MADVTLMSDDTYWRLDSSDSEIDEDDKEDENDADHQVGASDKAGPDRRAHSSGEQGTHHWLHASGYKLF